MREVEIVKGMVNEGPLQFIEGFFVVDLHNETTHLTLHLLKMLNNFLNYYSIISYLPIFKEASLTGSYNFVHKRVEPPRYNFSNDIVWSIAKTNRSVIMEGLSVFTLRNKTNMSKVYTFLNFGFLINNTLYPNISDKTKYGIHSSQEL